jgi:gp16 family phage-associated protein
VIDHAQNAQTVTFGIRREQMVTGEVNQKNQLRTRDEVIHEFRRKGISISSWARQHGVSRTLVHQILAGDKPCRFGQSHKIAVLLGIKEGEITEDGSDLLEQRSELGRNSAEKVPTETKSLKIKEVRQAGHG